VRFPERSETDYCDFLNRFAYASSLFPLENPIGAGHFTSGLREVSVDGMNEE
jgi:hypothetical protein